MDKLWARASFSFCSVTWTRKRFKHTHFWLAKMQHICKHFASQRKLLRPTEQCFLLPSVTYSECSFHLQYKVIHNIPNIDFGFHSLSLAIERSFITWSPAPSPKGISFTLAVTTRCFSSGISLGRPRISTLKIKKTLLERGNCESLTQWKDKLLLEFIIRIFSVGASFPIELVIETLPYLKPPPPICLMILALMLFSEG